VEEADMAIMRGGEVMTIKIWMATISVQRSLSIGEMATAMATVTWTYPAIAKEIERDRKTIAAMSAPNLEVEEVAAVEVTTKATRIKLSRSGLLRLLAQLSAVLLQIDSRKGERTKIGSLPL
jgi:hypothetical protein